MASSFISQLNNLDVAEYVSDGAGLELSNISTIYFSIFPPTTLTLLDVNDVSIWFWDANISLYVSPLKEPITGSLIMLVSPYLWFGGSAITVASSLPPSNIWTSS